MAASVRCVGGGIKEILDDFEVSTRRERGVLSSLFDFRTACSARKTCADAVSIPSTDIMVVNTSLMLDVCQKVEPVPT